MRFMVSSLFKALRSLGIWGLRVKQYIIEALGIDTDFDGLTVLGNISVSSGISLGVFDLIGRVRLV
jgi:hypothetical protein